MSSGTVAEKVESAVRTETANAAFVAGAEESGESHKAQTDTMRGLCRKAKGRNDRNVCEDQVMSELDKLEKYLKEHNITYDRVDKPRKLFEYSEVHQIIVYEKGERVWDAICHPGSYGYEEGLLEVMGEPVVRPSDGDTVCGHLTAEDVIARYEEYKQNGRWIGWWIE